MTDTPAYLWDTNVFYALYDKAPHSYFDHVRRFADEALQGKIKIFASSVVIAEIDQRQFGPSQQEAAGFFRELYSYAIIVPPTQQICEWAGAARSHKFINPNNPDASLVMGVADAIMLATALWLNDAGEKNVTLHTFDGTRKKGYSSTYEGKTVPIIGLERFCDQIKHEPIIQKVLAIKRTIPSHPLCPIPKSKPESSEKPPLKPDATTQKKSSTES